MERERPVAANNNLQAIMATLANSGLSALLDPATVTHGIQQSSSVEKAWLDPATRLVNHGQVEVQGKGVTEISYLLQQKLVEATVILNTNNSFEYLPSTMVVTAPRE
jgi:hypothetical protein